MSFLRKAAPKGMRGMTMPELRTMLGGHQMLAKDVRPRLRVVDFNPSRTEAAKHRLPLGVDGPSGSEGVRNVGVVYDGRVYPAWRDHMSQEDLEFYATDYRGISVQEFLENQRLEQAQQLEAAEAAEAEAAAALQAPEAPEQVQGQEQEPEQQTEEEARWNQALHAKLERGAAGGGSRNSRTEPILDPSSIGNSHPESAPQPAATDAPEATMPGGQAPSGAEDPPAHQQQEWHEQELRASKLVHTSTTPVFRLDKPNLKGVEPGLREPLRRDLLDGGIPSNPFRDLDQFDLLTDNFYGGRSWCTLELLPPDGESRLNHTLVWEGELAEVQGAGWMRGVSFRQRFVTQSFNQDQTAGFCGLMFPLFDTPMNWHAWDYLAFRIQSCGRRYWMSMINNTFGDDENYQVLIPPSLKPLPMHERRVGLADLTPTRRGRAVQIQTLNQLSAVARVGFGISGPPGPFRLEIENLELRRFMEHTVPPPEYARWLRMHKQGPAESETQWQERLQRMQRPTGIPGINLSRNAFGLEPAENKWGRFSDLPGGVPLQESRAANPSGLNALPARVIEWAAPDTVRHATAEAQRQSAEDRERQLAMAESLKQKRAGAAEGDSSDEDLHDWGSMSWRP